jgi:hypothetical protein
VRQESVKVAYSHNAIAFVTTTKNGSEFTAFDRYTPYTTKRKRKRMKQLDYLQEQENTIFIRRDEAEREVERVVGRAVTPLEFLQIRQAIAQFEECEDKIEKVQEQINDMRKWVE